MMVSIIIPVYNEASTVAEVVRRVVALPFDKQIIVVDDGSTDATPNLLASLTYPSVRTIRHEYNLGKGSAIRTALKHVSGEYVLIVDADLELLPEEIPSLLSRIATRECAVYGSRFRNGRGRASWTNYLGNRVITAWANLLYGCYLTDVSAGYKLFPARLVDQLDLRCTGFEFCHEITAKLLRLGMVIEEVPVSYVPRPNSQGKKLRYVRDGPRAALALLRWRLWRPATTSAATP